MSRRRDDRWAVWFDLRRQLPKCSGRGRERTLRALQRLELELAGGPGAEAEALRQLDLRREGVAR